MKFSKEDLAYKDEYSWKADGGDNPNYRGIKDRELVDKTEGYEVLHFCNQYMIDNKVAITLSNFRHVEHCLRQSELRLVKSRALLYKYIKEKWLIYAFTK